MPGNITIKDIAQSLGLSKSTVSRAFRDTADINPETRKKILDLAKKLDFRPSSIARGLKEKRTNTVGLIIPAFIIPFYSLAISGISDRLSKEGINLMTCQSGEDYEREIENIELLLAARVDGIIASISRETKELLHFKRLKEKGIPIVIFNRIVPELDVSQVFVDDYDGSRRIVQYMLSRGYRKIFHFAGPPGLLMSMQREKGYRDALSEAGIKPSPEWVMPGDFTMDSGYRIMKEIMGKKPLPDAVFSVCDAMAFGAITAIREQGLKIPDDIAIAGFTDEPTASLIDPPLTTVAQPIYRIGTTAAELLLEQLKGNLEVKKVRFKTELKIRSSV